MKYKLIKSYYIVCGQIKNEATITVGVIKVLSLNLFLICILSQILLLMCHNEDDDKCTIII